MRAWALILGWVVPAAALGQAEESGLRALHVVCRPLEVKSRGHCCPKGLVWKGRACKSPEATAAEELLSRRAATEHTLEVHLLFAEGEVGSAPSAMPEDAAVVVDEQLHRLSCPDEAFKMTLSDDEDHQMEFVASGYMTASQYFKLAPKESRTFTQRLERAKNVFVRVAANEGEPRFHLSLLRGADPLSSCTTVQGRCALWLPDEEQGALSLVARGVNDFRVELAPPPPEQHVLRVNYTRMPWNAGYWIAGGLSLAALGTGLGATACKSDGCTYALLGTMTALVIADLFAGSAAWVRARRGNSSANAAWERGEGQGE